MLIEIRQTVAFSRWLGGLKDRKALARILVRSDRLSLGNPGDVKPVGEGVSELRITYGPGYRVYFTQRSNRLVLLLCGGNKGSQKRDIATALAMAREIGGEN